MLKQLAFHTILNFKVIANVNKNNLLFGDVGSTPTNDFIMIYFNNKHI